MLNSKSETNSNVGNWAKSSILLKIVSLSLKFGFGYYFEFRASDSGFGEEYGWGVDVD
jgi:hypothetical protein